MVASFRIDQPDGAGSGTMGYARSALWRDQQINLVAFLAGSYEWAMLDRPAGSAAVLANTDQQTTSFTPDVNGTYRIRLIAGTASKILVARVDRDSTGVRDGIWALPAFQESVSEDNAGGNVRGSTPVLEAIFQEIWDTISGGLPSTPAGEAGGDLGGTYPNPSVERVKGVPFNLTGIADGSLLRHNGTNVTPFAAPSEDSLLTWVDGIGFSWEMAPELSINTYFNSYQGNPDTGLQLGSIDLPAGGSGTTALTANLLMRQVIRLVGALTGDRIFTLPTGNGRPHLFVNQTTGAYTLRIQGENGGFTYLLPGQSRMLWIDDTGVLRGEGLKVVSYDQLFDLEGDGVGDNDRTLFKIPPGTTFTACEVITVEAAAGGSSQVSLGTSSPPTDLLVATALGSVGTVLGTDVAHAGSAWTNKLSAFFRLGGDMKLRNTVATATLTAGQCRVQIVGRYLGE